MSAAGRPPVWGPPDRLAASLAVLADVPTDVLLIMRDACTDPAQAVVIHLELARRGER